MGKKRKRSEPWKPNYSEHRPYQTIFSKKVPGSKPEYGLFPDSVPMAIQRLLTQNFKFRPYSHQAEAAQLFLESPDNVSLITPTASGKSLAFLAPALSLLYKDPDAVVLILYPMNALTLDQVKSLMELGFEGDLTNGLVQLQIDHSRILAGALNGETPTNVRNELRNKARLIMTNPVALHHAILRQARRNYRDGSSWYRFFKNLKMVIIDEAHTQDGTSGTHTALALRRLWSLCEATENPIPKILLATATIGNANEHAKMLSSQPDWQLIEESGAGHQAKTYKVILPNKTNDQETRWPSSYITRILAVDEVNEGRKVLIFTRSRRSAEVLAMKIGQQLSRPDEVTYFHAGIPPQTKRKRAAEIMKGMFSIVVSTSALELGIDIGSIDTVILNGHPGDHASFFQRAGRVGRTSTGYIYVVLDENGHPMNAYLQTNPQYLFGEPESRTLYPRNHRMKILHAQCCYLETGQAGVKRWFHNTPMDEVPQDFDTPYEQISMLGTLGTNSIVRVLSPEGEEIQRLNASSAFVNWHMGAQIPNLRQEMFRINKIVTHPNGNYDFHTSRGPEYMRTKAIISAEIKVLQSKAIDREISTWCLEPEYVSLEIREWVESYQQVIMSKTGDDRTIVQIPKAKRLPSLDFNTHGIAFQLPKEHPMTKLLAIAGAIDTLEQVLSKTACLFVRVHPKEIHISIFRDRSEDPWSCLIYDRIEGGMGWSYKLARYFEPWFEAAATLLEDCECKRKGCPHCAISNLTGKPRTLLVKCIHSLLSEEKT